ncbi:hypothetical protein EMPS_00157 [Entomortierella parvispora]|uniref:3CxxC-type domain-containing protein n=1 Tax=Entomortierella parvispora TaxID=205924 RepID=A0A9P3LQT3_9FUNG|nr:hypothetical protein EMPS_00157 [Entomortierella parvispora]
MISLTLRNASRLRLNNSSNKFLAPLLQWSQWATPPNASALYSTLPACRAETFPGTRPMPKDLQELTDMLLKMDRKSLNRIDLVPLPRSARALVNNERCRRSTADKVGCNSSSSSHDDVASPLRSISETMSKLLSSESNSPSKSGSPGKSEQGSTRKKDSNNGKAAQVAETSSDNGKEVDGYHLHTELAKAACTFGYKLVYDPDLQGTQSSVDHRHRNMSALFTCNNGCQDRLRPHRPRTWSSSVVFTEFWFSAGSDGLSHPVRYRSLSHSQRCSRCNQFVEPELFLEKYIAIAMNCIDRWIHGEKDETLDPEPWRHDKKRCHACQQGRCRASVERSKLR